MEPKVCAVMIVKNEEAVIEKCIRNLIENGVDYIYICDTGSTDDTLKIINKLQCGPDYIDVSSFKTKFSDFSQSRNYIISEAKLSVIARGHGSENIYMLIVDADDILSGPIVKSELTEDILNIRINHNGVIYYRPSGFRANVDCYYEGYAHECLVYKGSVQVPKSIEILLNHGEVLTQEEINSKSQFLIGLLEKETEDHPERSRPYFYIAQSYKDMKNWVEALDWYTLSLEKTRWAEEIFYCKYMNGFCLEMIIGEANAVFDKYMETWRYRPQRLEPLYRMIVILRNKEEYYYAAMLSYIAATLPKTYDILFIEKDVYDWRLLDEFSVCASYCKWNEQLFRDGMNACQAILGGDQLGEYTLPTDDKERIQKNLKFYFENK